MTSPPPARRTSREWVRGAIHFGRPDMPLANIEAMYKAFLEFGTYG